MQPLRKSLALVALGVLAMAAPADAAWNNVFQVTCWNCRPKSSSGYYAPSYSYSAPSAGCCDPCPQPCPQTQCTTKYVQRCYYQPVTTYETKSYYEPVTTYQTSYYYEAVTTYRYSCYYDPCTCSYQQVACPTTCYQKRAKCCPVQTWVQRCCQVPVTTYQKSFYWEPQTTCCTTSVGAPVMQQPPGVYTPPNIVPKQTNPPPEVEGKGGNPAFDQYYQKQPDQPQSQYRQIPPGGQFGTPAKPSPANPPPGMKLDKIASASSGNMVGGQVVSEKNAPKSGMQLTFVSVQKVSADKHVTANATGQFQVDLPAGSWLIYMRTSDGQYVYHSRIEVAAQNKTPYILVSR